MLRNLGITCLGSAVLQQRLWPRFEQLIQEDSTSSERCREEVVAFLGNNRNDEAQYGPRHCGRRCFVFGTIIGEFDSWIFGKTQLCPLIASEVLKESLFDRQRRLDAF